jgi:hypothetical protein
MSRVRATLLTAAAAATMVAFTARGHADPLVGAYVGRAHDVDLRTGEKLERDIDIVIEPVEGGGLRVTWTNVTLVDGRRDVPGVKRRSDEMLLTPAPDRDFFLAGTGYDPFQAKQEVDPHRGDALRWGVRNGNTVVAYSFAILEDGRYELQTYERRLVEDRLALSFERVVDGTVTRKMTGHAVRAE